MGTRHLYLVECPHLSFAFPANLQCKFFIALHIVNLLLIFLSALLFYIYMIKLWLNSKCVIQYYKFEGEDRMEKNMTREEKYFLLLGSLFIALLVISNVIAGKVVAIGGWMVPAAVICYALTFAVTDTIAEIWGKERTKYIVVLGFFACVISAIMIKIAIWMPAAPFWHNQEAYNLILGSSLRITVASMSAYLISQYHDIWAFHFWKDKTGGKYLWIRNNLSTGVSQLIDTVVFIVIGFYGTGAPILSMILGQYAIKLIVAMCDTPIVYILVNLINKNIFFLSHKISAKG